MLRPFFSALLLASWSGGITAGELANPRLAQRYEQLLDKRPDSPNALDRLWSLYQEADATPALLDLYSRQQGSFSGAMVYGYLLKKAERLAEARASFAKAAELDPKKALPHLALAQITDDPAAAARELETAANLEPATAPWMALGNAWQRANQPEKAAAAWEKASSLDPANQSLHEQLAANYEQNHLPEKALREYALLAENGEPWQRVQAGQNAARILQSLGRIEEAQGALEKALALLPAGNWQRASIQSQLVRMLQRAGKLADLETRWAALVQQTPNDLGGYWRMADLYQELGDARQERIWLEKMAILAPEAADVLQRLGRTQRAAGDARAAAATLDKLLSVDGAESTLVFERADLDLQLDQPNVATARLEQLWSAHPEDEALQRRILDFYRRGRLQQPLERHLRMDAEKGADGIVALARYLFAERRPDEARAALLKLVHAKDPPTAQSDAWARIAAEMKDQSQAASQLGALREAARLDSRNAARRSALADALLASGEVSEARQQALAAWKLEPTETHDQKLFQTLQPPLASSALGDSDATSDPREDVGSAERRAAFQRAFGEILQTAADAPSPETLLRASRWQEWSQHLPEALDFAERALKAGGDPAAARKQILRVATRMGDRALAQKQLIALSELEPQNAYDWRRQLGQSQMDAGDSEAALKTFTGLSTALPKDTAALGNVALAQQQAGRWSDALVTWQRAYALAPASRRREAAQPLLRAMEHLGLQKMGAELLLSMSEATTGDPASRSAALEDVIAFARRHELTPWLSEQLERRRRRDPGDVPTLRSLAQLRQSAGDAAGSLEMLAQASDQAPDDAALLREVVRAAAEMGRPDEAIAQQRRLVQMSRQTDPGEWEALAQNEENAGDLANATATWKRIVAQFPRDVEALKKSAAFFARWQDGASADEALRRVRVLAPGDLAALLALAKRTESAEAISCYEQILQRSSPASPAGPLSFPDTVTADAQYWQALYFRTLQLRDGRADGPFAQQLLELWRDGGKKASGDAAARLEAIRGISQALVRRGDRAALADWLRRWDGTPPGSESLFAHYFSGERAGTIQVLNALMKSRPGDVQLRQAFIYLALKVGGYAELAQWFGDPAREAGDMDLFLVGVTRFASSAPQSDAWLAELFPTGRRQTFVEWQSAALLANEGRLRQAAWLGRRVFQEAPAQRISTGLLLARWLVSLGEIKEARDVLKGSVESAGSTLDDPVYDLLRHAVLLLPRDEIPRFEQEYLQRWRAAPLHAANARLLFAALEQDRAAVRSAAADLLKMAPIPLRGGEELQSPSEARYWAFLANTGVQLQSWHLDLAARELWQQAFADRASSALHSIQMPEAARELRLRALAAAIVAAPPGEQMRLLHEYAAAPAPDGLITLGALLESVGCMESAREAHQLAWQQDPANRQVLDRLINESLAIGDLPTARDVALSALKTLPGGAANREGFRSMAVQAAAILRQNNQRQDARKIMDEALASSPNDPALLARSAQFFLEDGLDEQAETAFRALLKIRKDDPQARNGLQKLLGREGRDEEAAALMLPAPGSRGAGTASSTEPEARSTAAIAAADALAAAGKKRDAEWRLWSALAAEPRPEFQLDLCRALTRLLPPEDARQQALLARSRSIIATAPAGATGYRARRNSVDPWEGRARRFYDERLKQGAQGLASTREDWGAGTGNLQAGLALMRSFAAAKDADALTAAGWEMQSRADELSQSAFDEITSSLRRFGTSDLVESISNASRMGSAASLESVRAFQKENRPAEALHRLEIMAARSVFDDELIAPVAGAYEELGRPELAWACWQRAVASAPAPSRAASWLGYAGFLLRQKEPDQARAALRKAYSSYGAKNFQVVYEQWLSPDATLLEAAAVIAEFRLSAAQEQAYWGGLLQRWHSQQNFSGVVELALAQRDAFLGNQSGLKRLQNATAKTGRFGEVLSWLEPAAKSRKADFPWLPAIAAGIYADWAKADEVRDIAASQQHLERAVALQPSGYELVQSLCTLYQNQGKPELKRKALAAFCEATRNVKERELARAQIAQP